ncbi:MAG: glycosyltransferase family 2 protein [Spirochaetaceae bacterium]|nr:glycosyltransferase family 2 protein [Spirochaetaceae bacterium]
MKQGFLIPLYNHGSTIYSVTSALALHGLPIIIVDDGSDEATKQALAATLRAFPLATGVRLKKNSGKGAAVMTGLGKAREQGLSHVLQIDADGQHDAGRADFFLAASVQQPEAAICGYPEYDASAPALRTGGRAVSNTWAQIVTLSGKLKDVLCGFRVYPVEKTLAVMGRCVYDRRMGFDPEVLIRLYWAAVPLVYYPVKVRYPQDGISHFHMVRDNIRISCTFTRLFFGMLLRIFPLTLRTIRSRGK